MSLPLRFPEGATRYPARHVVVEAVLVGRDGDVPVVVKKVREGLRERFSGSPRAERSLAVARALAAMGIATPEPFGAERHGGESWYVCRKVEGAVQIREWFLGRDDPFRPAPAADATFEEVVDAVARLARRLHDGGIFFRDFTDGNILVTKDEGVLELWLVDLDRARVGGEPLGSLRRLRDLARLGLNRREDQELLIARYLEPETAPRFWPDVLSALRHRIVLWDALKRSLRPWRR